jgi:hypothetical protein
MEIPKQVKISGKTHKVRMVRTLDTRGMMGETDHAKRQITVATHSNLSGKSFKAEAMADTFWHELTHAILADMDHVLWDDEKFVTQFANRLTEAIHTAKF